MFILHVHVLLIPMSDRREVGNFTRIEYIFYAFQIVIPRYKHCYLVVKFCFSRQFNNLSFRQIKAELEGCYWDRTRWARGLLNQVIHKVLHGFHITYFYTRGKATSTMTESGNSRITSIPTCYIDTGRNIPNETESSASKIQRISRRDTKKKILFR